MRFPLLGFGILMALVVFGLLLLAGNRDLKRKQKDPQWALYDEVRRLREEVERLRHEH
ncbi:MAG: hypothetical protein P3W93_008845 [Thermus sp.]|nr:hypothetical protein [Thermus sp.]